MGFALLPLSITIDIDPVLIQLGPFAMRWYGLMYVVGIMAGLSVALPYAKQRGLDEDKIWSIFWWGAIAALVGARLYYVVQSDIGAYLAQPWRILATWEGGMAFYGALVGAALAIAVGSRTLHMDFWTFVDAGALFAVVGQACGRIGNIINGDIVGYQTNLPWGFVYIHPNSFVADHTVAYQPAAVYELLFNIAFFIILWQLRFRLRRPGQLFATYVALYAVGQFVLFFLRDNVILFWGLKNAQLTSVVMLLVAVPLWIWLDRRKTNDCAAATMSI